MRHELLAGMLTVDGSEGATLTNHLRLSREFL